MAIETPDPKSTIRRERPNIARGNSARIMRPNESEAPAAPAAGAHAAEHLINDEATPGSGALPSVAHRSGKDVDGGAG